MSRTQRSPGQPRSPGTARTQRASVAESLLHTSSNTFPLPCFKGTDHTARAASATIDSLNLLYLGPDIFSRAPISCPTRLLRAPASRARSNILHTLHVIGKTRISESSEPCHATINLANLPSYQFFPVLSSLFSNPETSPRGGFQRIQAEKIDLPTNRLPPNPKKSQLWINRLHAPIRSCFLDATTRFRSAVTEYLKTAKQNRSLPQAHFYASKQEYAALLSKSKDAGMLHWSVVSAEDSEYSAIASDIQMTLFAVSKSRNRSRLISRPRVQNESIVV